MTSDHGRDDEVLDAIAHLRRHDVGERHAARLRTRCHGRLRAQEARLSSWKSAVGPALAGVWCAVYLVEVIRRAATIYGF
jgi:hypothetical protein